MRDAWRARREQLTKEFVVIAAMLVVAVLAVRIIRQPVDTVNGFVAVRGSSAPAVAPSVVSSAAIARLVPEAAPPAALPFRPRRRPPERVITAPQKPTARIAVRTEPAAPRPAPQPAPRPATSVPRPSPAPALDSLLVAGSPRLVNTAVAPQLSRAEAAPITVARNDRSSIERVLEAYRVAYDKLDASSAAAVWPRVDTRALNRAFRALAEQDVSFNSCDLDIGLANANARCVGEIRYVGRVGDQSPRVRRLSWSFELERVSDRWQIAQVATD